MKSSSNENNLFELEENIYRIAIDISNNENYANHPLLGNFKTLSKEYKKLLRQLKKIVKISDHQQKLLSEANEEKSKAFDELNSIYKIIKQDLQFAKGIQEKILPKNLNLIEGLKFFIEFIPMVEVGGDIYDIAEINDGYIRIFLADATGHGIQASLMTMIIKTEYENLKTAVKSPDELIELLNYQFMNTYKSLTVFFTVIVMDIDLKKEKISYCSAGHPSQYIISDQELISLPSTGKPIGIIPDAIYTLNEFDFRPKDKLFLYSDGVFEEFNNKDEEFGEERMIEIIQKNIKKPIRKIIDNLLNEINKFIGDVERNDDITIIGVE